MCVLKLTMKGRAALRRERERVKKWEERIQRSGMKHRFIVLA